MRHPAWFSFLLGLLLTLPAGFARAGQAKGAKAPAASPYGNSYTPKELAAIDRALHAANMTREDLRFQKDVTKGHACLPVVRKMMDDPLEIPVVVDSFVNDVKQDRRFGLADAAVEESARYLAPHSRLYFRMRTEPIPETPEELMAALTRMLVPGKTLDRLQSRFPKEDLDLLRQFLPPEMDWHDVFPSPFGKAKVKELEKERKKRGPAWLHETAAKIDVAGLAKDWENRFGGLRAWLEKLPKSAFPKNAPLVRDTPYGRVAIGTFKDDVYDGDYAALVDPGGNDHYRHARLGCAYGTKNHRVGFFADLGGNDVYDCSDVDLTLGAAVLGESYFLDLGAGNDRYLVGHGGLGAAMGGVAVFYDDGGSDVYEGKTFTEGAAGFGIGLFLDDAVEPKPVMTSDEGTKEPVDYHLFDDDHVSAWANSQSFARCRGISLLFNQRGNDTYEAGGVYLDAPLWSDRYQSFSQGFAIGEREIDYAGGVALVVDLGGNDRYLGDIYDQGVGYWYSAGLLYDGGGNDMYEMTQYGQGSGIHLAVGGLVDESGNDTYVLHAGLGEGGSHDYAASMLFDRGGNDQYYGNSSANGCGLTNSVGILIDRSGNDTYAGRKNGGVNFGRPARGFSSIGILVDLGGADDFLGVMKNGETWRQSDIGVGVDVKSPKSAESSGPGKIAHEAKIPAVCRYRGKLTEEVFDKLWAISVRWEVGDNRYIVPVARKRIAAFGPAVLPMLDGKMEEDDSGLEFYAFNDILGDLIKSGARKQVTSFLRKNLTADNARRRRVALYLVAKTKAEGLEPEVLTILAGKDAALARQAAGTLHALGSHAGDARLLTWLDRKGDERKIQTAIGVLVDLEADCYPELRPLLDHPLMSVRTLLATALAKHMEKYGPMIVRDLGAKNLSLRAKRTLLDVLARSDAPPDDAAVRGVVRFLSNPDWGARADAARVIRHWQTLKETDPAVLRPALFVLDKVLETEKDPYVLFCGRAALAGDDR